MTALKDAASKPAAAAPHLQPQVARKAARVQQKLAEVQQELSLVQQRKQACSGSASQEHQLCCTLEQQLQTHAGKLEMQLQRAEYEV